MGYWEVGFGVFGGFRLTAVVCVCTVKLFYLSMCVATTYSDYIKAICRVLRVGISTSRIATGAAPSLL